MDIVKPEINGRTDREKIEQIATWANNLADSLNYILNHMDSNNMVPGLNLVTEERLEEKMQEQYKELRKLIIERTKGE